MKILHYAPTIDKSSGGISAYIQLLSRDLGKLCELHIVTHHEDNELLLENCFIHYINNGLSNYFKVKKEFCNLLDNIKPNIVHSNCCWYPYSAISIGWAKDRGYKTILTPHGMLEPWILARHHWTKKVPALLLYQKAAIKKADLIHATAYSEKDNIVKLGWNSKVKVIANCVQIDGIDIKESWKRKKRILFLSRVHVKKGVNFLIEAVSILKEEMQDYKIIIAGPGENDYVDELKSMAKDLCVDHLFEFVGSVFGNEKWEFYKNADLFVLPTHSENFGIVVTEALASGTPVITTKGTPWKELDTKHCGWWIEVGTKPLVKALREFIDCREDDLRSMGINGRKLVEDNYASETVASQFMDMYNALL